MTHDRTRLQFSIYFVLAAILLVVLVLAFWIYARAEKAIDHANEQRLVSLTLAEELRHSTDDLTRMARSYVVTGNPAFKNYFQEILAIRDGKQPRPEYYRQIFWDLISAGQLPPRSAMGPPIALLELIRQTGIPEAEFRQLEEAKVKSDQLTATEFEAFRLMETVGPNREADRTEARLMLFDDHYHQAKADIMKPLQEFTTLMERRTREAVHAAEVRATILRNIFIAFGLSLIVALWRTHASLRAILGAPVAEVHAQIVRLGQGDFSPSSAVAPGKANSVVGWLAETRRQLSALDQAQRTAANRYQHMLSTTKDAFWLADGTTGRLLDANEAAVKMFGFSRDELRSMRMADVEAARTPEAFQAHLTRVRAEGGVIYETRQRTREGGVIEVEVSMTYDQHSQTFVAFLRDITERKLVEQALARSRVALEQAQALAHLGSWTLDFASNRMEWSPEVYRISGMAPGTPVDPQSHIRLVHPDDFDFFEAAWQATLQGASYAITHRIIVAGRVKWVHARAEIAFDAEGQPQSAIGTLQDITEHKEAEDALRQSQVFLQGVLDSVSSHIAVLDRAGVIVAVNEAWRRFSRENSSEQGQLAPHTDIGTNYLGICSADASIGRETAEEAANIRDGIQAVLDGRLPTFSLEYACHSPHEQRWFLMTVTPLGRGDAGAVVVHTNISERKRYEQALQQARNVAETANRAKSEFLAHMSHEIRTPLNAVLGLSQVLNHEPLTADQRVMVDSIQAAGRSLLAILNDILDFSKIEAGQLRLEPRPFGLGTLLAKLDSLMGQAAQARGLALRIVPPFAPPGLLVGDALRLEQVLINLLGNAIKFTEQGEVDLQIEARETDATAVRLRFTVRDTGIGIAPEALARLFAPFTQAEAGITRRFGGTGLGLAICKRLVELMDGEIGVESQVGRGSTFWFELPFARVVDGATVEKPAPERPIGPRLAGLHFLVVDDNAVNRELVVRVLKLEGATAALAADGQQAVQLLKTRPAAFDAVLMDVQMPVMDGLTATRLIRGELGLTELPILAFTAGVLPEEQQAALAAGCNAVLAKPVNLKQMAVQLLNWVTSRPAGADTATD